MKRCSVIFLMGVFMFVLAATNVLAQDKVATPADARALVKKVVAYAKANGCEKTFAEINKGTAFKIYKNAYPSAAGLDGMSYANVKVPALVGKSLLGIKDAKGVPFVKNSLEKRKSNFNDPTLETEYAWMDKNTGKVETRTLIGAGFSCGGKIGDISLSVTYEGKM